MPHLKFEQGGRRMDAGAIMRNALDILRGTTGKLQCGGNSMFRGVGPADVIHAMLAKRAGCDELVTFDTGFEELHTFDEFEDLKFRVMKW